MIQRGSRLRLAKKASLGLFPFQILHGKKLQSDDTAELGVLGLVDDTHAAPADLGEDLVMADGGADHDAQLYRRRIDGGNKHFPPAIRLKAMLTQ